MKILYVVGAYGRRYVANEIHQELVQEYIRRGHQCIVYAGVTPGELGGDAVSYRDGDLVVERQLCSKQSWHRVEFELSRRLFHYPRFLPLLRGYRRIMRAHPDVDVVHADAIYPIGALAALATPRHVAVVPSIHGGDIIDYPGYGYRRFKLVQMVLRYTWRRSALIRVNSHAMAALAASLGCPRTKLRPVLVNIGDRFFDTPADLATYRAQCRADVARTHGLDPAAPLVVTIGRLLPLKGFADAIAAWPTVLATNPDAHLIVAGPNVVDPLGGDQRAALAQGIRARGLDHAIHLLGPLDYERQVMPYLAAADLLLAVAHVEGLNRVVAEAGALGTPSVVTSTTPVADLVAKFDAGTIIPPRDPAAIARALGSALAEHEQWAKQSANARKLAQRFRAVVIADQLLDVYGEARAISQASWAEC